MKKSIFVMLFILAILLLSSCNIDEGHEHDYSNDWGTNETHHWKSCSDDDCDSIVATSEHSFGEETDIGNGNKKHICSVCLFEKITHEHIETSEYTKDDNYHWFECMFEGCDYYGTKTEHSYGDATLEKDGLIHSVCKVCSHERTEVHTHTFASAFTRTEREHYYECTFEGCAVKDSFAEHSYSAASFDGENETQICTDCGYEKTRTHAHSYTGTLVSTEEGHFYSCSLSLCTSKGETFAHEWNAPSFVEGFDVYVCSVCKYSKNEVHTHIISTDWQKDDNNHWKKCTARGCNHTESQSSHAWVSDGVVKEPSQNSNGEEKFICEVCRLTKIEEIEYVPPKMTENEWVSYFCFDNLKLQNTYSFGEDEFVDIWLIDGENILITNSEYSSYGSLSDLMSFAFIADYYDSFDIISEGQYFADTITHYDAELEEEVTYKNVGVCFSDSKILKIEFDVELGVLGTMTDRYDFIEWGGIVVPVNPRETVTLPESISEMLGYSLDNFTMVESVSGEEDSYSTVYLFDGSNYSYAPDGEDAVIDSMSNAGVTYAYDAIGFFYSLDEERFIFDEANSADGIDIYTYECGITVDGVDYDSITVKLFYEDDEIYRIVLSYALNLLENTVFEYDFSDFGTTEVGTTEKALVYELYGKSINQVSVSINEFNGSGAAKYTQYSFDYSDYEYGDWEYGFNYARLKDSAAVFITNWLGTLVELDSSDFSLKSSEGEDKIYKTNVPVISNGVTYLNTEISLLYDGNEYDGYELMSIDINFKNGENGKRVYYTFTDFGSVFIDTQYEEENKEIPEGYLTKIAKDASLLNYTLFIREDFFVNGESAGYDSMTYEFDSHRGRYYSGESPEDAEYISEDYAGMAFATEYLSIFSKLDGSKYVKMSSKPVNNITKYYYEYDGSATVDGITLKNICVFIAYKDDRLDDLSISYSKSTVLDGEEILVDVFCTFYSFGDTVVVFPEDDTVAKFGYSRFNTENYAYRTVIYKNNTFFYSASGIYDSNKYFEEESDGLDGKYYYTENAGLRDYNRYFRPLLNCFSEEELQNDYDGANDALIYTSNSMKSLYISIGKDVYYIAASNFEFSFFYTDGELAGITLTYDCIVDGSTCRVVTEIYGIGEQSISMPES